MLTFLQPRNFCDGAKAGVDFGVQPKDMLSVRLTANCSERCGFCIAAEDMKVKKPVNVQAIIDKVHEIKPKALNTIGGEPLLFLNDCIQLNDGISSIIETNWFTTAIPKTLHTQWDLFQTFMNNPIVKLIVSIQSFDWEENNKLMNSRNNFNRLEVLEKILYHYSDRVQVNVNLVRGGIDTHDKLWAALDMLASFGAKRVRLNELQSAPFYYVNFEKISGIEMKAPYAYGCKTMMPDDFYPGMNVQVKRSCFMVEPSLGATEDEELKLEHKLANPGLYAWAESGVIYEDGTVTEYWQSFRQDANC